MDGFILIHRQITDNWIWQRAEYYQWFTQLLMKANFKDNDKVMFEGGFIQVKRGQFVSSYAKLAKELPNCTPKKIRNFVGKLIESETLIYENLKKGARFTFCNYDSYQKAGQSEGTVGARLGHGEGTVGATIERKIKKDKERKLKIKKDNIYENLSELENIFESLKPHFGANYSKYKKNHLATFSKCLNMKNISGQNYTAGEIIKICKYVRSDSCWYSSGNFQSPAKLVTNKKNDQIKYLEYFEGLYIEGQKQPQVKQNANSAGFSQHINQQHEIAEMLKNRRNGNQESEQQTIDIEHQIIPG